MFTCVKGQQIVEWYPKLASTALAIGTVVRPNGSGFLTNAVAATTRVYGVLAKDIVAADSDYATANKVPVIVPRGDNEFEADVTGTLTTAMIGEKRDLDATGLLVDAAGTSHGQVTITAFISASKCRCKINANFVFSNAV